MSRRQKPLIENGKKESDYTDEQRAWYCKWIIDNKCDFQEPYLRKFQKHLNQYPNIPDLTGKLIKPNGYGGMDVHEA